MSKGINGVLSEIADLGCFMRLLMMPLVIVGTLIQWILILVAAPFLLIGALFQVFKKK